MPKCILVHNVMHIYKVNSGLPESNIQYKISIYLACLAVSATAIETIYCNKYSSIFTCECLASQHSFFVLVLASNPSLRMSSNEYKEETMNVAGF